MLLAHTSLEKSRELAEQFPLFRVVATAGGMGDPTYEAERVGPSDAMLVQVGIKGMHVGVVGLFDDPQQPLRYQRVPLDSRFPDSSDMLQLLASYQEQLQQLGLEGLGLRPIPYSDRPELHRLGSLRGMSFVRVRRVEKKDSTGFWNSVGNSNDAGWCNNNINGDISLG